MTGERERSSESAYTGTLLQEFFREVEEYAIFLLDADGTVASWNDGAARIKGYTRGEILGRHVSVFYSDDSDGTDPEEVLSLAKRDGSYEEEGLRVRSDGTEFWAHVTIRALYDEDGTLDGFAKIVRDISETREYQEQLERSRDRLERTEQLADVGGWELSFEPRAVRLTDGARQLLDVPNEAELTVRDVATLVHEDDRERVDNALERARQRGELLDLELRIVTAAGRKRWMQLRGRVGDDGEAVRGAIRDISARKEREERLMVLNRVLRHNLRNNLNVVTGYANELKKELDELDVPSLAADDLTQLRETVDDLTDSTAGVDTELAVLDQLVSAVNGFETESAVQMTDRIIDNAEDLMSTGEKARTFEQAVDNDVEKRAIPVRGVFSDVKTRAQRKHPNADIQTTSGETVVFGSEHSLRLALDELVQNAIIHSGKDSPTVELAAERLSAERVTVSVKDDGPGIPTNEEAILRRGNETALNHGSGMGLWTVHWVVTQMGGDVSITRRGADGSTVEIHLPAPRKGES